MPTFDSHPISCRGCPQHYILQTGQSKLFTWDNPLGKRQLVLQVVGEKEWFYLEGKKCGSRKVRVRTEDGGVESVNCQWMIVFEGSQKVLRLFDSVQDYQQVVKVCM